QAPEAAKYPVQHFPCRLLEAQPAIFDGRANMVGGYRPDEVFAVTGGRDGADTVLGVRARPNDGRVSDTPLALVGHAASGGRRGEIAARIEGHRANGARGGDQ